MKTHEEQYRPFRQPRAPQENPHSRTVVRPLVATRDERDRVRLEPHHTEADEVLSPEELAGVAWTGIIAFAAFIGMGLALAAVIIALVAAHNR